MIRIAPRGTGSIIGGALEVDISHVDDSITLGDGTDTMTLQDVGGTKSVPVKVLSTTTDAVLTGGTSKFQITDTVDEVEIDTVGAEKALKVSVIASVGGSGGTSATDGSAFTADTSLFTPIGGQYDADNSADLADGEMGMARVTAERALHVYIAGQAAGGSGLTDSELRATPVPVSVSGVATDAKLDTIIGHVDGLEGLIGTTNTNTGASTTALQIIDDWDATAGAAHPSDGVMTMGSDGTNARRIKTDSSGELQIDVLTSALPSGAATETTLGSLLTSSQLLDDVIIADNAGFTDGTTKLSMNGYIYDEVAGTALTENDAAAARIDSKRAQIQVIEDGSTRGRWATVSASNALKVDGSAVTQPVSGTFWQATQPVSGTVTVTDVATETTLGSLLTSSQLIDDAIFADDAAFTHATSKVMVVGGTYQSSPNALDDNDAGAILLDASHRVQTVIATALPSGTNNIGDVDVLSLPALAAGTNNIGDVDVLTLPALVAGSAIIGKVSIVDGAGDSCMDDTNNALKVNIVAGAGSGGTAMTDDAAFTVATTSITPVGGVYNSVLDAVDDGDGGAFQMTSKRAMHVNLRDNSGTELTSFPVTGTFWQATQPVSGTFWQATQPVSGTVTVTGVATETTLDAVKTSVQLLDDAVFTDDAAFTPATSKGLAIGAECDETGTDSVDEGDFGVLRMTAARELLTKVNVALPAGTNNIGDVDVLTMPDVTVVGKAAHDAAVSGNPVRIAGRAMLANGTATAEDDVTDMATDNQGRVLVTPHVPRDLTTHGTVTLTNTTETTVLSAGGASVFLDLTKVIISNSSSTATRVQIRDTNTPGGTIRLEVALAANGGAVIDFGAVPMCQTTANNPWSATLSGAVTSVYVYYQAIKRIA